MVAGSELSSAPLGSGETYARSHRLKEAGMVPIQKAGEIAVN